jgi:hypothetical protein
MPRPSLVAVPDRTGILRSVYGGVAKQSGVVARAAVEGAAVSTVSRAPTASNIGYTAAKGCQ